MNTAVVLFLGSLSAAAGFNIETSPDADIAAGARPTDLAKSSEVQEWFWKSGFGGLGGFTTSGAFGGGFGGPATVPGGANTIFFTSSFTETLTEPITTQFLTIPGFTTTIFFTPPAVQPTSLTTIQLTTTVAPS